MIGALSYHGSITDLTFCHDLPKTVPACLAETIVHGLEGNSNDNVSDVVPDRKIMEYWLASARKHGFEWDNTLKVQERAPPPLLHPLLPSRQSETSSLSRRRRLWSPRLNVRRLSPRLNVRRLSNGMTLSSTSGKKKTADAIAGLSKGRMNIKAEAAAVAATAMSRATIALDLVTQTKAAVVKADENTVLAGNELTISTAAVASTKATVSNTQAAVDAAIKAFDKAARETAAVDQVKSNAELAKATMDKTLAVQAQAVAQSAASFAAKQQVDAERAQEDAKQAKATALENAAAATKYASDSIANKSAADAIATAAAWYWWSPAQEACAILALKTVLAGDEAQGDQRLAEVPLDTRRRFLVAAGLVVVNARSMLLQDVAYQLARRERSKTTRMEPKDDGDDLVLDHKEETTYTFESSGAVRFLGFTKQGRPILWVLSNYFDPQKFSLDTFKDVIGSLLTAAEEALCPALAQDMIVRCL